MDTKKIVIGVTALGLLAFAALGEAKSPYDTALRKWTRFDRVYVWDNFEARVIWHATYLSEDFRAARRKRLSDLLEWTDAELMAKVQEDAEEAREFDVFFVGIYAGSSKWPDVGKNSGAWRLRLETGPESSSRVTEEAEMERIPVTPVERELYSYLDPWTHAYYVRFPKTLNPGEPFRIRMAGIPAKSQLVWK